MRLHVFYQLTLIVTFNPLELFVQRLNNHQAKCPYYNFASVLSGLSIVGFNTVLGGDNDGVLLGKK